MYSPFKMKGKSPMMKALIGKQNNLPEQLKAKILAAPDSPAKMMKKSPAKKKTEREKLNKLVEKRTKLRDKKVKREDKEKNTRRVDRKLERNQAKINANSKAQEDKNKKNNQVRGERMVPTKPPSKPLAKTSPSRMMKKSPAKMAKKSPAKKINPFSAEYKKMTVSQRKKKYGEDYKTKIKGGGKKDLTVANVKESLGNLNKKIKTGANKLSNVISPKDASGKPQKKTITTKGGRIKVKNKSGSVSSSSSSSGGNGGYKPVNFKGKKGDPYKYRTLEGGGFEYSKDGKTFTKATKKGNEAIRKMLGR